MPASDSKLYEDFKRRFFHGSLQKPLVTDLGDRTSSYLVIHNKITKKLKKICYFLLDFVLNFATKSVASLPKSNLLWQFKSLTFMNIQMTIGRKLLVYIGFSQKH